MGNTSLFRQSRPSGHISPRNTKPSVPAAGVGWANGQSGFVQPAPNLHNGTCSLGFVGFAFAGLLSCRCEIPFDVEFGFAEVLWPLTGRPLASWWDTTFSTSDSGISTPT
jgi:hypothetical protein